MVVSAAMVRIGMGIYYSFDGPIVLQRYFKYFLSCFLVVSAVYKINIRIVPAVDTYLRRTFNIIALRDFKPRSWASVKWLRLYCRGQLCSNA